MATTMAISRAKAMAVAICTDGGKGNGNIGGKKKHWQMRGWGKSTGGKFNGEISAAGKSPWQHTCQRKGQLALRAKALATQVAKLWQKLWQRLNKDRTRKWEITRKSKPRRHIAWPHNIVCSRWLAQATSELCHIQSKRPFSMV